MKNNEFGKFETKEVPSPTPILDEILAELGPISKELELKELSVSPRIIHNLLAKLDAETLTQMDIEKKLKNLSKKPRPREKQKDLLLSIIFNFPSVYKGDLKKLPVK